MLHFHSQSWLCIFAPTTTVEAASLGAPNLSAQVLKHWVGLALLRVQPEHDARLTVSPVSLEWIALVRASIGNQWPTLSLICSNAYIRDVAATLPPSSE
ncbi:hypothetical protein [Corynebacterium pseudopelargi]|uniref:hypothetical protein n=1 Tax=Corynebacterium pseudopelargi TaxID=2080757 RepID=UPI0013DDE5CE|nr:hypothetical protein [Corynebacterium pseudopelargi]